jgi:hypothetical protein
VRVIISNKLPQLVTVTVKGEGGEMADLKLGPNASSEPIDESRLTDHARLLIGKGHLRLRPAAG